MTFGRFRLDFAGDRLWRGPHELKLRPKSLAVLRYLLDNRGRVVGKNELFGRIWPRTKVSGTVLKVCVREIRTALEDDAARPTVIETLPRKGYRWIAPVTGDDERPLAAHAAPLEHPVGPEGIVERGAELGRLREALEDTRRGERRVVFVTGEAGLGKTALVDAFVESLGGEADVWIAHGQAIEHFGSAEPYLPIFAALGDLCRGRGGDRLVSLLARNAPTWLAQMPSLASGAPAENPRRVPPDTTRERMLRELAEALEALTSASESRGPCLVLVLEDLHWCDTATLDLISFLARRRQGARILLIGTYRPVEVIVRGHPLRSVKQDLQLHGQCREISLSGLSEAGVADYVSSRFGKDVPRLRDLSRALHRRTEGNPLFVINVLLDLVARRVLIEKSGRWRLTESADEAVAGVPENLQQMVERQLERLSPEERTLLEVASVAGPTFSAAVVADACELSPEEVELRCGRLLHRSNILEGRREEASFGFVHALYRDVAYRRLSATRRATLHRKIGERIEATSAGHSDDVAAELAIHFQRAGDHARAVRHLRQAGDNAVRKFAHADALAIARQGLKLLKLLPESEERRRDELYFQAQLGTALMAVQGWQVSERESGFARARELSHELGEEGDLFWTTMGLWAFHLIRGELESTRELSTQLLALAERTGDDMFRIGALCTAGSSAFYRGEPAQARDHLERLVTLYDPNWHAIFATRFGVDPGVIGLSYLGIGALWPLGFPEQAMLRVRAACALADELAHPQSRMLAYCARAWLHHFLGEADETLAWADRCVELSSEHGVEFWRCLGAMFRGWALTRRGETEDGLRELQEALVAHRETGAVAVVPHFLTLVAEAFGAAGRIEEGLAALADAEQALETTGERHYEVEMHRLRGQLALEGGAPPQEAEASFRAALDVARSWGAIAWELRAATSLARLWAGRRKKADARRLVKNVYDRFDEGLETADLTAAETLLRELG